ncbi:MAG: ArdC-like ssDNA-binding domain-containing protein, partial [Rhodospirillales bacterium]|nr:ArdC-like ssDNA-binding domain-containing protein [Rhodospirillales bacterium]
MSGGRRFGRRGGAAGAADRSEAYYRKVADHLIDQIESGTARWTQAWQPGEKALPRNVATGKAYRGGNSVWLASVADMRGYQDERWGTYKQVEGLGGQVRRGQRGSAILFWQFEARKLARDRNGKPVLDENGKPVYETMPLDRPRSYPYTVFNAEQCSGLPRRELAAAVPAWDSIEAAERVLKQSGAEIDNVRQDRVYYDLGRDLIVLPLKEQFPTGPTYYQSARPSWGTGRGPRTGRTRGTRRGVGEKGRRPGGSTGVAAGGGQKGRTQSKATPPRRYKLRGRRPGEAGGGGMQA